MKVHVALACLTACLTLTACNNTPQNQERVREDTARATATIKSDVKGAAEGIRDGLRTPTATTNPDKLVDINSANKARLETLPGIDGPLADRIIAHRPYSYASDLTKRHVLSASEYDRVEPRITTSR